MWHVCCNYTNSAGVTAAAMAYLVLLQLHVLLLLFCECLQLQHVLLATCYFTSGKSLAAHAAVLSVLALLMSQLHAHAWCDDCNY